MSRKKDGEYMAREVEEEGSSEPDVEEPLPTRRHKQLIRRSSSFKKFSSISGTVDTWFFLDAGLRTVLVEFAEKNVGRSRSFSASENGGGGGGVGGKCEMDLHATEVHLEFCSVFETQLEAFLESNGVSMDEFQEMFKIENEEEKREGTHFYRWIEVLEFDTFLVLMQATAAEKSGDAGVTALMKKIEELSAEAKTSFRKQSALRPLLIRWCPSDFATIANVLQSTSKTIPHGLDKATVKSLLAWKGKLTNKVMMENVYVDPPRDEDAWTRYLSLYTSKMTDETFSNFIAQVDGHVAATTEGESDEAKTRRSCWECFAACDPMHEGVVDLHFLLKHLEKIHPISGKQKSKMVMRWAAKLIPRKPKSSPIPLAMVDFTQVLNDVLESKHPLPPQEFRDAVAKVTHHVTGVVG